MERTIAIAVVIAVLAGVAVALRYKPDASESPNTATTSISSALPATSAAPAASTAANTSSRPGTNTGAAIEQPVATITTAAEFEAMFVHDPSIGVRDPNQPSFVKDYAEKVRAIAPISPAQEQALEVAQRQYQQQWQAAVSTSGILNKELTLQDRRRALDYARRQVVQYSDDFVEGVRHQFVNEAQIELLRQLQQSEYKRQIRELRYKVGLNN